MAEFSPGDIIIANVPFEENPTLFKLRPAMVVSMEENNQYSIAKITKTDLTGKFKGEWIEFNSFHYKAMRLDFPSFIKLEALILIPRSSIVKRIGKYPNIEKLLHKHGLC